MGFIILNTFRTMSQYDCFYFSDSNMSLQSTGTRHRLLTINIVLNQFFTHSNESKPFPPHSFEGVRLGAALFPELADRTVKAATERESTHRFSTKWHARSCRLLNVTPSSFCAHSQIKQEAADNSSSSEREPLFSCNNGFTINTLFITQCIIN